MTINEALKTYRLPNITTQEYLDCRWVTVLRYGNRVLLAGLYYQGIGKPSWYGAVYEFVSTDTTTGGEIELAAVSDVEFEDEGHAIEWAMKQ